LRPILNVALAILISWIWLFAKRWAVFTAHPRLKTLTHSATRMGQARNPNALANRVRPVFGHVRQGRNTYRKPGGAGGSVCFFMFHGPSAGRILPNQVETTTYQPCVGS
jgi:hypothetical protein